MLVKIGGRMVFSFGNIWCGGFLYYGFIVYFNIVEI